MVTADPEGRSNSLFLYIGMYTVNGGSTTLQSEEGQTPYSLPRNGHSRSWGSPSYPPLYWCMYHPGGRFSLANKVQECMGLTFVLYWSFSSPTYPFSATPSCYCSCLVNMRQNVNGIYVIKKSQLCRHSEYSCRLP